MLNYMLPFLQINIFEISMKFDEGEGIVMVRPDAGADSEGTKF
jgi:hypothetical protein